MKVLSINTYAGSLLVAAQMVDAEIVASLEDEQAYGVDIQKLNFGDQFPIKYGSVSAWNRFIPDSLLDHVVIAHPPCSAFSVQNNSQLEAKKGLGATAFKCTENVLDFSMRKRADALLIESVVPALEGAREVHDAYAKMHGYRLFRIVQNSKHFGVPQDRARFWAIFVREDLVGEKFYVQFEPFIVRVGDVIEKTDLKNDYTPKNIYAEFLNQRRKWFAEGVDEETIRKTCCGSHGPGQINGKWGMPRHYDKFALYKFRSRNVRLLDINGFTNTLLSDSFWIVPDFYTEDGRVAKLEEYNAFMGFPRSYKFPEAYRPGKFREFLSKGVCPPVAAWILDQVQNNLYIRPFESASHVCEEGKVLDLSNFPVPVLPFKKRMFIPASV